MRRTKLTAVILLIVASMLGQVIPTWAQTIDSINLIDFDFEVTPTSGGEYYPEIFGTNYTTSDFGIGTLKTKKYGRQRNEGVWNGFATLNFDNIAEGSDFAAYAMIYANDATESLADIVDNAAVAYNINAADTVAIDNLYFALLTKDENGVNFAGVPVGAISETQGIALSEFTKQENFLCSTGEGTSIDLSKFCGLGFVRMKIAGDQTAPESSGRIFTSKFAVLSLKSIDDLSAEANKGKAILSFTAPTVDGLEYEINAIGSDGTNRTITLTADDFEKKDADFVWTDGDTRQEITYTYTVTLKETTYGLSSVSNSTSVTIPEDIGGEDIPTEGDSSAIVDVDSEDYHWITSSAWGNQAFGGFGEGNIFTMVTSSPFGTGRIMATDLGYDRCFKNAAEAAEKLAHVVDYYATGYLGLEVSGGPGNAYKECVNASKAEGGYAVYSLYIDETVDLTNAYFSIGQRWYGNKDVQVFAGVPMENYVTQADKGKKIRVAVPLDDFKMSNPEAFCRIWKFNWEAEPEQERVDVDLQYFCFIGLLRNCEEGIEKPATSGYVYIEDLKICKVNPVTELEVRDSTPSKIVLGWEHTDTLVEKYNIYREANGQIEKIGTSSINRFADIPADGLAVGETYTYYVEAEDELGIVSEKKKVSATIQAIGKPRGFNVQNFYSDTATLAIDLSWQAPAYGDVDKYVIYRNGEKYQEIDAGVTSFRDSEADYGVDYTYYIYAVDTDGNKSIDTEEFTLTSACVPAVENVSYSISGRNITYTWDENPYAVKYAVKVNDDIYYTEDTTYTVENFPYYVEVNTSIWAMNGADAKSVVSEIRKFAIEKPGDTVEKVLFGDSVASGFKATTLGYAQVKAVADNYVIGNKSLLCDFSERSTEDQAVCIQTTTWDVTNYLANNARLSFWIYAGEEVDFAKVRVGLQGSTVMNWTNSYPIYSLVELDSYASEKGKWAYVEIPFGDFDIIGVAEYQGQSYYKELDMDKLTGLAIFYDNLTTTNGGRFYIDNLRIVKGAGWQVATVKDGEGNAIATTASANAKEICLTFTENVNPSTFTSENVWIEDENGGVVNTFIAVENGVCKIKLLETLAQNTGYSIKLNGVKSSEGVAESFAVSFTTNGDEVDGNVATISDIVPTITVAPSGSTVSVNIALPQGSVYNVADYTVTVEFDKTVLNLNGANTVTLEALSGANIALGDGIITISGNAEKAEISGSLATAKFSVVNTTTTTVKVGGSFDVVNAKADKTASANINVSKSFAVSRGGSAVGGGGGGGGGGGTANREDATIKGESEIKPTDGEGKLNETVNASAFTDINNVSWAKEAILALVDAGVMSGYPDGTVRAENTITREEFTSLLMRVFSFKSDITESPFVDVANDAWYANAVIAAKEKGIVSGVDTDNFGIGSTITREDMCTMIYRAIQVTRMVVDNEFDAFRFADEDQISDYASEAVSSLYRYGVISGVSESEFAPKAEVNRAMAARVLYGVMNLM